ncbi:YncE family protein [Marinobacter gelidimuriae]|uniref:YncE family protein n=1 Tax=Marinobacter gelidimuriae TaxID=2739064 RepID=UPI000370653E|nr:hypothetical protein [Marinobacter gelidimuriae]
MKHIITSSLLIFGLGFSGLTLAAGTSSLETTAQPSNVTGVVKIPTVTMGENGFVVIHESNAAGKPVVPNSVGFTRITKGRHSDVIVILNRPLQPGEKLFAMLHRDTGKAGVYEFGPGSVDVDQPIAVDGKVALKAFNITATNDVVNQAPTMGPAQPISNRDRVYSADQTSNTLTVINPATNTVLGTLPLGDQRLDGVLGPVDTNEVNVHGLGFSRDGRHLLAISVTSNAAQVIDAGSNSIVQTMRTGRAPHPARRIYQPRWKNCLGCGLR